MRETDFGSCTLRCHPHTKCLPVLRYERSQRREQQRQALAKAKRIMDTDEGSTGAAGKKTKTRPTAAAVGSNNGDSLALLAGGDGAGQGLKRKLSLMQDGQAQRPAFTMETAAGQPDYPSAESLAAARAMLRTEAEEAKENADPGKRFKSSASFKDPRTGSVAGGGGGGDGVMRSAAPTGFRLVTMPKLSPVKDVQQEDEEDEFEDSFLDAPDLDLTSLIQHEPATTSAYFAADE